MNQEKGKTNFHYRVFHAKRAVAHLYVGFFQAFGWKLERTEFRSVPADSMDLYFREPYSHYNQPDILRLQRKFESTVGEIEAIEENRTKAASHLALIVGLLGVIFAAGALIAGLNAMTAWTVVFLLLGCGCCIGALFCYVWLLKRETMETETFVWGKYEDLYRLREEAGLLMRKEDGENGNQATRSEILRH